MTMESLNLLRVCLSVREACVDIWEGLEMTRPWGEEDDVESFDSEGCSSAMLSTRERRVFHVLQGDTVLLFLLCIFRI